MEVRIISPFQDVAVSENAADDTISLFETFDDPFTTGQIARFQFFDTTLGNGGVVDVVLFDQAGEGTPTGVANFLSYANAGDYDDSIIHRSVPGFVIQGGGFIIDDFSNPATAGDVPDRAIESNPPLINDFSDGRSNLERTISFAKLGGDPDSATSQWFFNLGDNSGNLDNQNGGFTVFGQVRSDVDFAVVEAIASLPTFNGSAINPAFAGRDANGNTTPTLPLDIDPTQPIVSGNEDFVTITSITNLTESELTFEVVSNSNPSLVDPQIDDSGLILDYLPGQSGVAEITVRATNLTGETAEDTFTVTVSASNAPPIAIADTYSLNENGILNVAFEDGVLINDSDPDGDAISASLLAAPTTGNLNFNADGSFTFTPETDFVGPTTFTYQLTDSANNVSNPATVTIDVNSIDSNDFDRDNNPDVLIQNNATGEVGLWLMNGTRIDGFAGVDVLDDWTTRTTGDFNQDGNSDVMIQNNTTGEVGIWLMNQTRIDNFAGVDVLTGWTVRGTGDFNDDNNLDVLIQNNTTGEVGVWFMDATRISGFAGIDVLNGWTVRGTGDFNDDSNTDVLIQNNTTGEVGVWFMDDARISGFAGIDRLNGWTVRGARDYTSDQNPDIMIQNNLTGEVGIWLMNDAQISGFAGVDLLSGWTALA
ncbi:MAG: peptidylprolyl isomerase [Cyanobacteria bacterium P01_H01_bin.15]